MKKIRWFWGRSRSSGARDDSGRPMSGEDDWFGRIAAVESLARHAGERPEACGRFPDRLSRKTSFTDLFENRLSGEEEEGLWDHLEVCTPCRYELLELRMRGEGCGERTPSASIPAPSHVPPRAGIGISCPLEKKRRFRLRRFLPPAHWKLPASSGVLALLLVGVLLGLRQ